MIGIFAKHAQASRNSSRSIAGLLPWKAGEQYERELLLAQEVISLAHNVDRVGMKSRRARGLGAGRLSFRVRDFRQTVSHAGS